MGLSKFVQSWPWSDPEAMKDDLYSMYASRLNLAARQLSIQADVGDLLNLDHKSLPLKDFCIYSGTNLEAASKAISSLAEKRQFSQDTSTKDCYIEISRAKLAHSQIGTTFNSTPVRLTTSAPITHYSVTVPLIGEATYRTEDAEITVKPMQVCFLSAGAHLNVSRSSNHLALIIALNVPGFELFVGDDADLLTAPEHPFVLAIDFANDRLANFGYLLGGILRILNEQPQENVQQDTVISRLEQALWYKFFGASPEVERAHRDAQRVTEKSAPVERVIAYVNDHADKEITMPQLVEVSGVSLRSLHTGFRQFFGYGPMAFVRKTKLRRCREQLIGADGDYETVGDIAATWGFFQLSNFAKNYRLEFGELPSDTLSRKTADHQEVPKS